MLLLIFSGYLCGSIPFGLILTRLFTSEDLRQVGSGNIGATNVLRTGNKKLALATLLLDAAKASLPILMFGLYSNPVFALTFGLSAIIGHCFPIWLKFKGGKGVATALGVLLAAIPITGFIACLTWILSFLAARISSLAALTAIVVAPCVTWTLYGNIPALLNAAISLIIIVRHKDNINRLRKGEEHQFKSSGS